MSSDASFLIDTQEKRRFKRIFEKIKTLPVKVVQLKAGDFLITGERGTALIERKAINDFTGSMSGERLFDQMKSMYTETAPVMDKNLLLEKLADLEHVQWIKWSRDIAEKEKLSTERLMRWAKHYWKPYTLLTEEAKEMDREWAKKVIKIFDEFRVMRFLLVEGSPTEIYGKTKKRWTFNQLMSAMVSVPIGWNINLIWITDTSLTSSFIYSIARYLGKPREPPKIYGSRPKRSMRSPEERQRFLLEGISGVSGQTADKWLEFAGSASEFFKMLRNPKVKIPGLSMKRKAKINAFLDHKYEVKKKDDKTTSN